MKKKKERSGLSLRDEEKSARVEGKKRSETGNVKNSYIHLANIDPKSRTIDTTSKLHHQTLPGGKFIYVLRGRCPFSFSSTQFHSPFPFDSIFQG